MDNSDDDDDAPIMSSCNDEGDGNDGYFEGDVFP